MRMFDTAGYLHRLHLGDPGAPSVSALQTLHKAHVERVAYEALDIQLHRPTSIDPYQSAERIVRDQRGGYCYHLNGAFSLLLSHLGYQVVWHRAGGPEPYGCSPTRCGPSQPSCPHHTRAGK
jgi:N-hydroxyarylamine O-acetyltransferase